MKLKKGIIFITANVVNKRILCVFSIILFIMSSHAQVKELSMELELLNVSRSNIHPSPQGGIIGDTVPVSLRECNLNSVWFLFLLNHNKYNFFFLDLQMLLKVVFGCVQGRRRMSRLYTLAHIRELPFLCV